MTRRKPKAWVGSVYQDGLRVAGAYGPTKRSVQAEIAHYAMMYGQDGPVRTMIRPVPARKKGKKCK